MSVSYTETTERSRVAITSLSLSRTSCIVSCHLAVLVTRMSNGNQVLNCVTERNFVLVDVARKGRRGIQKVV